MSTSFAAVIFRPAEVSDRALSHGFAVALAGWDVAAPSLLVAELRSCSGWSAAFYRSGAKLAAYEELDHAFELFEDELPPGLAVRDAAVELGGEAGARVVVYALAFSDEVLHDDAWRFSERAILRRFAREGDEGLEAGTETLEGAEVVELEVDLGEDATDAEEAAAVERAVRPHRGSTFLSAELGVPIVGELVGALFAPDRRVAVRLFEPTPESIASEVQRLDRSLRRVDGRGAFTVPVSVGGVATPPAFEAFVEVYDWADPADPEDLYRELSIGRIEGTLRFSRAADLAAKDGDPAWAAAAAAAKLFPIASLRSGALGAPRSEDRTVALGADGESLFVVGKDGRAAVAGPTFAELLRYLALGWKQRDDVEEDLIGALMLRAKVVVGRRAQ